MKLLKTLSLVLILVGCQSENQPENNSSVLSEVLENSSFEVGAVIACGASDANNSAQANIYFYPEQNAENFTLYETRLTDVDPNNFSNYTKVEIESEPFFNGFLRQYSRILDAEKWVIVTFNLENEIKVSNPIRTKQISKPSIFNQDITVNQSEALMPQFLWAANEFGDNAIYFQIISDIQQNVFSATYTFESNFQYYNTSNVVLNITEGIPPNLQSEETYSFSLMDVSEDNWVNAISLNANFTIE
ncbi:hypothetical protein [Winogradskyella haliclonae]|uniref:Uncharacterized protein n=1 Tax=Winogradskyella haliclonae TaxID=2048558 RepID=A0ABQ2C0L2_9FLAO|nr:hypothetical protein [Winogradskyella haliclonae]GGI56663.1 hypothetical protein GCM10011444_09720 [Winogradskyella haliclonae]